MTEHQCNHPDRIGGQSLKVMASLGMEELRNALSARSSFPRHSSEPGMRDHLSHGDVADRSNSASQERKPRLAETTHTDGNSSRRSRAVATVTHAGVMFMFGFVIMIALVGYGLHQLTKFAKNNPAQSKDLVERLMRLFGK